MNDDLDALDRLARRLAEYGWIVRLNPTPPVHLVVHAAAGPPPAPDARDVEYLLVRATRSRLLRVWAHAGARRHPLGSVVDADDAHVLIHRHVVAARAAADSPVPAGTVGERE